MKNWLIALQTPYNEIKFMTNYEDNYVYLEYYDFFLKMVDVYMIEPANYRKALDEIGRIIVLDRDTGNWERQPIDAGIEHTMEELLQYNEGKEVDKKSRKDRYKDFIKDLVRRK